MIQYISLKREGDKIYLLLNLIEVGYLSVDEIAAFRGFAEGFWAGDFSELILPRLNQPEPQCANCGKRRNVVKDSNVANGAPLCDECYKKISDEILARVEGDLRKGLER